ncbi:MAG: hypothetical protein KGJ55_02030 [Gammaproteobacteria bacterium]|nr:hypothetical protein [Gammaproteobacteria bacterium]
MDSKARPVAAVNESNNDQRVLRMAPDMIVAPQICGGELLAMALAGEPVTGECLRRCPLTSSRRGG